MNASKKLIALFAACLSIASCTLLPSATTFAAAQESAHTWEETLVCIEPACEEGGYEILLCTDEGCDEKLLVLLGALGHDETLFVTEQPTCTESGTAEIRCSRCGRVREAEIAAAGHDYVTCEEGIEVCSRCKETAGEEYHKPFLWLIVVICAGAAIIAVAIVLGYKSFRKAKAREETLGDEENNDENGDGDKDGDEDADGEDEDS